MIEEQKILSINSHKTVHRIFFASKNQSELLQNFFEGYKEKELPYPQLLSAQTVEGQTRLLVVGEGTSADYKALGATHFEELSSVTMTCHGSVASDLLTQVMKTVDSLTVHEVLQDSTNLTLIVDSKNRNDVIQKLHTLLK